MFFESFKTNKKQIKSAKNNSVYTLKDLMEWADCEINTIKNTEMGWAKNGLDILNHTEDKIIVKVSCSINSLNEKDKNTNSDETNDLEKIEEKPTDTMLNLQYFFPIYDRAKKINPKQQIILALICNEPDSWRIRTFLSIQNSINSNLCICTVVTEDEKDITECEAIPLPLNLSNISIKNLFPLMRIRNNKGVDNAEITPSILNNFDNQLYEFVYTHNFKGTDKYYRTISQYEILIKTGKNLIKAINVKIKKDPDLFWEKIREFGINIKRYSFLTQLIWLDIIRNLLENEELCFDGDKSDDFKNIAFLSLWDSIAYGEGIAQLVENSVIHSQGHTGYLSIYLHNVSLKLVSEIQKSSRRRYNLFRKYRENRNDSFLNPSDKAYLEFNVIDMGLDEHLNAKGIEVKSKESLETLFKGIKLEKIDDVIHHYGMPLFYRTIQQKNGRFICRTPGVKNTVQFFSVSKLKNNNIDTQEKTSCLEIKQPWTSYQILVPVGYNNISKKVNTKHNQLLDYSLLKDNVFPQEYQQIEINNKLFSEQFRPKNSSENLTNYKKRISDNIKNSLLEWEKSKKTEKKVIIVKLIRLDALRFELRIKGLFSYIAEKSSQESSQKRILFRLIFLNEYALSEALRRFAVFYDRLGTNKWMKNVQIAMCTLNDDEISSTVKFVLAGENIYEAYITAKQYMHYHTDKQSGVLLSQIEYLSNCIDNQTDIQGVPLFPFDLVKNELGESDFILQAEQQINNDLQEKGYGCKIKDAHIQLGSRIHVRDFYDVELMFQNIANVYRFAYLLASDIYRKYRESPDFKVLYLIGYESYSSVLVSEVNKILNFIINGKDEISQSNSDGKKLNIIQLQYVKNDDNLDNILPNNKESIKGDEDSSKCVVIMPIGTTLSTFYKILNTFQREYMFFSRPSVLASFALVLIGDCSDSNPQKDYWIINDKNKDDKMVVVTKESIDDTIEFYVIYYLMPKTEWLLPNICKFCGVTHDDSSSSPKNHIPLCQVDRTSTMPSLIFPLKNSRTHGIGFTTNINNEAVISKLKSFICYGHLRKESNHYQYFINYVDFYKSIRHDDSYKEWMDSIRNSISENEFNIVISPLKAESNLFIKDIIDNVFQHSLRFMYLSLDKVYREEIRSRFSYIAQEYNNACSGAELPRYNVYFVDYSMVSGQTLQRSKMMINMLIKDIYEHKNEVKVFKKIILLTNRSSRDTASLFVDNPEENFLAYSTLRIPSFNTLSNRCPTCDMVDTYNNIAKCSATNEMYWYYKSLAEKHSLSTPEEHLKNQQKLFFNKNHYARRLYQDLILRKNNNSEKLIELFENASNGYNALKLTINDIINNNDQNRRDIESCYKEYRDNVEFRRLISNHRAVTLVEELSESDWNDNFVFSKIWDVIYNTLQEQEDDLSLKREWLISYIKIFSREYPAKIFPVRKAIYQLMEILLISLLKQEEEYIHKNCSGIINDDEINNIYKALSIAECNNLAEVRQIYQIYLTITKRLCDLQSNVLLDFNVLKLVEEFIKKLKKKYEEIKSLPDEALGHPELLSLPDDDILRMDYLQHLKWATMGGKDESKAFLMKSLYEKIIIETKGKGDIEDKKVFLLRSFANIINIENTRLLYSGIKNLDERLDEHEKDSKKVKKSIKELFNNARDEATKSFLVQNPLSDMFRFLNLEKEDEKSDCLYYLRSLYKKIMELSDAEKLNLNKDYLKVYGEICFYFSKLSNYKNCCIIHNRNGNNNVLAQYYSESIYDIGFSIDSIIDRADKISFDGIDKINLENTVYTDKETKSLVVMLKIKRHVDIQYFQKIYIVFFNSKKEETKKEVRDWEQNNQNIAPYLLFMRQRFQIAIERDLYALYHFRNGLEDVKYINTEGDRTCILHLTDLHISKYNYKNILQLVHDMKDKLKDKNPELMLVTGDVVQGNSSAVDLQENYQYAAKILRAIAEILWTVDSDSEDSKLIDDWKKRIIIIPGNHDYASMNELSANHTLRATTGGAPITKNGTPMSKYSYYIQFLQDFLGIESSVSIKNNLNGIFEFPHFGLRVVALNSISEVGPIRNNKMQLDEKYIENLKNKKNHSEIPDELLTICIAHHTRKYFPDYFFDCYYEKNMTEEINSLAKLVIFTYYKGVLEVRKKYKVDNLSPEELESIRQETTKEFDDNKSRYKRTWDVFKKDYEKTSLYNDIEYLCEHWSEPTNERCAQIINSFVRCEKMAKNDYLVYRHRMKQIESIYKIQAMLGGHTHRAAKGSDGALCVEGMKFYDDSVSKTKLFFGKLFISKALNVEDRKIDYSFSEGTSVSDLNEDFKRKLNDNYDKEIDSLI